MRTAEAISGRERRIGLWGWKPGPPRLYPMPDPAQRIYALAESDDGGVLIAKHSGVTKLRNGKTEAYSLPAGFQPHRLLRDRDGGLWIGALVDSGLLHIHNGRTDRFSKAEGLSGTSVTSIFEDREGSIWVATIDGLEPVCESRRPYDSCPARFVQPRLRVDSGREGRQSLAGHV